ncbi:MAG: LysR family transcriptional regulator [Siphonobacter aquaeclarae]|nr:LysR family transcriptional regulator [Siphonobacter aquaeclarae]
MIFDFRLHVFRTAARRLNFTKAADELCISQPAVTKHIHKLERMLQIKLFERSGSGMKLSQAGKILLAHSDQIFAVYRELEFEINALMERQSGTLRLGASTTVAQYVLPPLLPAFRQKFPDIHLTMVSRNSDEIFRLLGAGEIDLGMTESAARETAFRLVPFLKDEIVLVARTQHPVASPVPLTDLPHIPLLLREPGSGTRDVLARALRNHHTGLHDLQVDMELSSTESIKQYMLSSDAMAFLSIHAVMKELGNNECRIVDIEGLEITRSFSFLLPHGQAPALSELFMKFIRHQLKV